MQSSPWLHLLRSTLSLDSSSPMETVTSGWCVGCVTGSAWSRPFFWGDEWGNWHAVIWPILSSPRRQFYRSEAFPLVPGESPVSVSGVLQPHTPASLTKLTDQISCVLLRQWPGQVCFSPLRCQGSPRLGMAWVVVSKFVSAQPPE